jgi:superfamily II DNA helicase RecQ
MIIIGHCVSQWGIEGKLRPAFRSQYKELHVIRTHTDAPVAVFTATLTPKMMKDVVQHTCLIQDAMETIIEPPDRHEIKWISISCTRNYCIIIP